MVQSRTCEKGPWGVGDFDTKYDPKRVINSSLAYKELLGACVVHVSNPDALGAFLSLCPPQYPGPGAQYFASQGRKPGTKLPCKRKVKTAQKFHIKSLLYSGSVGRAFCCAAVAGASRWRLAGPPLARSHAAEPLTLTLRGLTGPQKGGFFFRPRRFGPYSGVLTFEKGRFADARYGVPGTKI